MKLNEDSIKWAIQHLSEFGDTDLFPYPVELKIISDNKEDVLNKVKDINIGDYNFSASRRFMIPKDELSYRIATQMNPIDSILFCALMHQFGGQIESKRASTDKVFSYRFSPETNGKLYSSESTWEKYWEKCEEKARHYKYVAYLDISDFYNQIYHHTIENQMGSCGFPNPAIKFIKKLLTTLTQKNSRGIPIGPHVSHLLAEMSLIPIDESISFKGFDYCRYVDDFVIFTNSYEDARLVFYHLAETLDKQQRLVIQRQKSKIIETKDFLKLCAKMRIDDPINEKEQEILDVIRENSEDPYAAIKLSELEPEDLEVLSFDNINDLLQEYISQPNPNYSRIRWLYRRLAQIGIPHAVDFSISNMERLIPAINDICL
jgi:retron-type reverse transcriptase